MKKIRFKKKYRIKFKNILSFIFLVFFSFFLVLSVIKIDIFNSNEELIDSILLNTNCYKKNKSNIISKMTDIFFSSMIKNPSSIMSSSFNYNLLIDDEGYNPEVLEKVTKHIVDPSPKEINQPIIYIYNSHQLENYSSSNNEPYNITPNVMMASYMLREKLGKLGIESLVEESDITEFIRINNWNYNYSYLASRYYINDAKEKNKSLKYFIDIHRDAVSKKNSTVTINNKNYASILFVVGLEHSNYNENLNLVTTLSNLLNNKYPNISKGILKKQGKNVNGIYNQDLDPNVMLIEIGAYENTIDEVDNTIDALANIIAEYINEKK